MHHKCDDRQSQRLDAILALHELKLVAAAGLLVGPLRGTSHELLTVAIRYRDTAELLQDCLQSVLWDVLELLTEVDHREFELGWHAVESNQGVKVDHGLDDVLLVLSLLGPAVLVCLLGDSRCETAQKLT